MFQMDFPYYHTEFNNQRKIQIVTDVMNLWKTSKSVNNNATAGLRDRLRLLQHGDVANVDLSTNIVVIREQIMITELKYKNIKCK